MAVHPWSRRLLGWTPRVAASAARPGGGRRPRLEALEDRTAPSAGQLHLTFGTAGKATASFTPMADGGGVYAAALDHQGRIVVSGGFNPGYAFDFEFVARFLPNGDLDPSFGGSGRKVFAGDFHPSGAVQALRGVAVDS